jgi:hypothetical protein
MVMPEDRRRINEGLDAFEPAMARSIRAVRAKMRKLMPTAFELVYDNYNFFVIAYVPTEKPSHAFVSIAADMNGVNVAFLQGAKLPDPAKLLIGKSAGNRMLRLTEGAKTLDRPEVLALLREAIARAPVPFASSGKITTVLRSVSPKRRPRRQTSR